MERTSLPLQTAFGTIRDARPGDAVRIVQMVGELAGHHGDMPTLTAADLARDAFGETQWIHVLVAESVGDLIGYAALCGAVQLQFGARGMDLHHLFTETRHRGRGVGQGLVEACKIKARALSCRSLTVGTHPGNHRAQTFYESLGFQRKDAHPPRFSMPLGA